MSCLFGFGFSFEGPEIPEMPLVCLTDFQAYAQKHLSKSTWDYIEGGADECFTRDDNITAFKRSVWSPVSFLLLN